MDDDDSDKSFFGWVKDTIFLWSLAGITAVMATGLGLDSFAAGDGLFHAIKSSLFALIALGGLSAGVILLLSCLRWFFRLRLVAAFFAAVGAFLTTLIGGIAQLFAGVITLAISLAIIAGIAGLLLFGIRQLF